MDKPSTTFRMLVACPLICAASVGRALARDMLNEIKSLKRVFI